MILAKRPVVVTIGGQRYTVRSDADETYVRTLAGYVDERIAEMQQGARSVPTQKLAVLAAMNIADDLLQQRRAMTELRARIRDKSRAVLRLIDKVAGRDSGP
jgi:cell division protein ZapA